MQNLLPGCHGYIAGLDTIDRAALQAADQLKVIARYGVGVDKVDLTAAREMGIVVTNTPAANAVAVAELTVGLMLSLARSIPQANAATKAGGFPRLEGVALEGKVVGLLGLGAIGKQVARRLRGFDCTVLAFDTAPDERFAQAHGVELRTHEEVVSRADLLSLHLPVLPETRGLVNTAFLHHMKRGAFFINTARGELVDEAALLEALRSGHLRGAALDAFATEPPPPDHPLLALPQVIATPHTGAHTDGATNAMGRMALRDCLAVLRGEEPAHRVV
jgi:D-3-phosphoglycerate dehydrogenase